MYFIDALSKDILMKTICRNLCASGILLLTFMLYGPAGAAELRDVRLIAFDGGFNLPVWVAQRKGFFAKNGINVSLSFTPNSVFLVKSLFENKEDIALTAFNNVVAHQ